MRSSLLFMSLLGLCACGAPADVPPTYTVFIQGHLKGTDLNASMLAHNGPQQDGDTDENYPEDDGLYV